MAALHALGVGARDGMGGGVVPERGRSLFAMVRRGSSWHRPSTWSPGHPTTLCWRHRALELLAAAEAAAAQLGSQVAEIAGVVRRAAGGSGGGEGAAAAEGVDGKLAA